MAGNKINKRDSIEKNNLSKPSKLVCPVVQDQAGSGSVDEMPNPLSAQHISEGGSRSRADGKERGCYSTSTTRGVM